MYDVRRVLGISRGGDAALTAVAQLAGGDYDMGGADNVGDTLALAAVRQLLAGCEVRQQCCRCSCSQAVPFAGLQTECYQGSVYHLKRRAGF